MRCAGSTQPWGSPTEKPHPLLGVEAGQQEDGVGGSFYLDPYSQSPLPRVPNERKRPSTAGKRRARPQRTPQAAVLGLQVVPGLQWLCQKTPN